MGRPAGAQDGGAEHRADPPGISSRVMFSFERPAPSGREPPCRKKVSAVPDGFSKRPDTLAVGQTGRTRVAFTLIAAACRHVAARAAPGA